MNVNLHFVERLAPSYVQSFKSYVPSPPDSVLQEIFGCGRILRLNNNENALGPSQAAAEHIRSFNPAMASIYPNGDCHGLRHCLAKATGLPNDSFVVGNGANELISLVMKAFCQNGDNIVTADKTFAVYEWVAEFSGIEARLAPLSQFGFDPQAMLDQIDSRTKIVFVCNPNNPTGTYWSAAVLRRFMAEVGGRCVVVLDEAYAEFVEKEDFPDGIPLTREHPNLIVFRTFSKMHGLAALRVGYLAGHVKTVDIVRRVGICYSVNSLAQLAATAALEDAPAQIARTRRMVDAARSYLRREMGRLGLACVANEGNFMMVRLPMSDTAAYRKLMRMGVMVRTMTCFRFPNYIRVTFAELHAMEAFVEALETILRDAPHDTGV